MLHYNKVFVIANLQSQTPYYSAALSFWRTELDIRALWKVTATTWRDVIGHVVSFESSLRQALRQIENATVYQRHDVINIQYYDNFKRDITRV